MYVCLCVYVCVCTCVCVYVYVHVYICVQYVFVCACVYVNVYSYICLYVCVVCSVYACMRMCGACVYVRGMRVCARHACVYVRGMHVCICTRFMRMYVCDSIFLRIQKKQRRDVGVCFGCRRRPSAWARDGLTLETELYNGHHNCIAIPMHRWVTLPCKQYPPPS